MGNLKQVGYCRICTRNGLALYCVLHNLFACAFCWASLFLSLCGATPSQKNNCSSKTCYCVIALVMQGECVVMSERKQGSITRCRNLKSCRACSETVTQSQPCFPLTLRKGAIFNWDFIWAKYQAFIVFPID